METLIMVGQLLLGLSILVGVHEWGHMVAAKSFGMRVEKFSIGFPPKIWGKQIGETEYSIGAIPLGGFVKITGMIDESLDTKTLSEEPEPYEFRAKPAWQRLIVMMGGIIVNVITGIIIFIGLALANGESYLPKEELNKYGIVAFDLGEQLGFETGDKILSINGQDYERFSDILSPDLLLGSDNYYTVLRNGEEIRVDMPNDFIDKFADKQNRANVIFPRWPFYVESVMSGSNADKAGLKAGDKIVSVDGAPIKYFDELSTALDNLKGKEASFGVLRDGEKMNLEVQIDKDGTIGFYQYREIDYVSRDFSFGEVQKAFTGAEFIDIDSELATRIGIEDLDGVIIAEVKDGSAADKAGLRKRDVIRKINGLQINNKATLEELIAKSYPGDELTIVAERDNEMINKGLVLTNREGTTSIIKRDIYFSEDLDANFESVPKVERDLLGISSGVKVVDYKANGFFASLGIPKGFIITQINNRSIDKPEELSSVLANIRGRFDVIGIDERGRKVYYPFRR